MISDNSVEMKYYQATLCSCVAKNNGHPDPNCGCHLGFRYPSRPETVNLMRTSVDFRAIPDRIGTILQGGCTITVPRQVRKLDDDSQPYYENCDIWKTVNVGDVFVIENRNRRDRDILKKGIRDHVSAFDVQEIISVSHEGTEYTEGTDFEFIDFIYPDHYWGIPVNKDGDGLQLNKNNQGSYYGGVINWLDGGQAPAADEFYTVEFLCKAQYVVYQDLAKDRGGDLDLLPKRLLCTLRQFNNFGTNQIDSISL